MRLTTRIVICIFFLIVSFQSALGDTERKLVNSELELPRNTYEIPGTITELIESEEQFGEFASEVRANLISVLNEYEIKDQSTLQRIHKVLVYLDVLDGNHQSVLDRAEIIESNEDKPANRLTVCLYEKALAQTGINALNQPEDNYHDIFYDEYYNLINNLPWDTVQLRIMATKGRVELASDNVIYGVIRSEVEPSVAKLGHISDRIAYQIINMKYVLDAILPVKEQVVSVLQEYIDNHYVNKPDIWIDRDIDISDKDNLNTVILAIWDTGVDPEVFQENMWHNDDERLDRADSDGNGFSDDIHGIAYSYEEEKTTGLLYPIDDEMRRNLGECIEDLKGFSDLNSNIESPEATALKLKIYSMHPDDYKEFRELMFTMNTFIHGTQVAGVAIEGNPAARLLVTRTTPDCRVIPEPMTLELCRSVANNAIETVQYYKDHNVRVVNMSWAYSQKSIEHVLEANGIGDSSEDRAEMAEEMFTVVKDALYNAIKGAPEILFVAAAGNEDQDIEFTDQIPGSFELPNVITVGAVDQAGDETNFTSFGEGVDFHANGFEVETVIPGGERIKSSGTSFATPKVVNLAAKLLAIDPTLTVEEIIDLIRRGAEKSEDGRTTLINPRKSIELLEARMGI